jgi:hypothetical protein
MKRKGFISLKIHCDRSAIGQFAQKLAPQEKQARPWKLELQMFARMDHSE